MQYSSHLADRWQSFGTSVFTAMSEKAKAFKAVNLAQGFPDFAGPKKLLDAVSEQLLNCHNQYSHATGEEKLRVQLANWIGPTVGLELDPATEITVTTGATEALYSSLNAFVNPGDRVVVFEPFYDSYGQAIANAGGIIVPIRLHAPNTPLGLKANGWAVDWDEFNTVAKSGFKVLLLNTPHNPTGKVFSHDELEKIANAVRANNAVAICDEVYENLVYDDFEHISLLSLSGMKKHVVKISSAAKTFGFTGFKIGWVVANAELSWAVRLVHQGIVFCTNAHIQLGLANTLEDELWVKNYLQDLKHEYREKRDFTVKMLKQASFEVAICPGSYFVMASYEKLDQYKNDIQFAMHLIETKGVAAIPPSAFYLHAPKSLPWLRFAFCKKEQTLENADLRLNGQNTSFKK